MVCIRKFFLFNPNSLYIIVELNKAWMSFQHAINRFMHKPVRCFGLAACRMNFVTPSLCRCETHCHILVLYFAFGWMRSCAVWVLFALLVGSADAGWYCIRSNHTISVDFEGWKPTHRWKIKGNDTQSTPRNLHPMAACISGSRKWMVKRISLNSYWLNYAKHRRRQLENELG